MPGRDSASAAAVVVEEALGLEAAGHGPLQAVPAPDGVAADQVVPEVERRTAGNAPVPAGA